MGRVQSVASDDAYNVTKNPALLSWTAGPNNISVGGVYECFRKYNSTTMNIKTDQTTFARPGKFEYEFGTFDLNYTRSKGLISYGFSLGSKTDNSKSPSRIGILQGTNKVVDSRLEDKTGDTFVFTAGTGIRLAKYTSVGISVHGEYSKTVTLTNENVAIFGATFIDATVQKTNTRELRYDVNCVAGLYQKIYHSEIGVMISSGTASWLKKDENKELYMSILQGFTPWKAFGNSYYQSFYSKSPVMTAGYYGRPFRKFGFAFEVEMIPGLKYHRQEPSYMTFNNLGFYTYNRITYVNKLTSTIRGGVEIKATPYASIFAGGLISNTLTRISYIMFMKGNQSLQVYTATAGVEYLFREQFRITIGMMYNDISIRMIQKKGALPNTAAWESNRMHVMNILPVVIINKAF